jgi:hypothetical protein
MHFSEVPNHIRIIANFGLKYPSGAELTDNLRGACCWIVNDMSNRQRKNTAKASRPDPRL